MSNRKEGDLKYYKAGDLHPGPPASGHAKAELALRYLEYVLSVDVARTKVGKKSADRITDIGCRCFDIIDDYFKP